MLLTQKVLYKILFRLRMHHNPQSVIRRLGWRLQGARFGSGTAVPPMHMSWPHQVSVGKRCVLEPDIFFKYDGQWHSGPSICLADRVFVGRGCEFNIRKYIQIGSDSLIASGCKFIDHNHAMALDDGPMNRQPCPDAPILLEEDVWLGVNVTVLKGVTIGRGAVIGAGAVVTKSVPPHEIWAGIPARQIGVRGASDDTGKKHGKRDICPPQDERHRADAPPPKRPLAMPYDFKSVESKPGESYNGL